MLNSAPVARVRQFLSLQLLIALNLVLRFHGYRRFSFLLLSTLVFLILAKNRGFKAPLLIA